MAVITQCPLSLHGLSSRAQQKLTRQASPSTCTTKTSLCYKGPRPFKPKYRKSGIKPDSKTPRFKANQLRRWQAMLEICLTPATPIPARLSFRV